MKENLEFEVRIFFTLDCIMVRFPMYLLIPLVPWMFQLAFPNWSGSVPSIYTSQICVCLGDCYNHFLDTRYSLF